MPGPQRRNTYFTDINVHGAGIQIAQSKYGLRIIRAVDLGMHQTPDPKLLAYAVEHGYVMVSGNFRHFPPIAKQWIAAGKTHHGLIVIGRAHHKNATLIADRLALYETEDLTDQEIWI